MELVKQSTNRAIEERKGAKSQTGKQIKWKIDQRR
jgi:hypothetical protein